MLGRMANESRTSARVGIVACGALALHVGAIVRRRGWDVQIHPLPPLLHNRPERIAPEVDALLERLAGRHARLAVGYADCGTRGALDHVLARHGVERLPGLHCYDVVAGAEEIARLAAEEPGTYFLTDFLVRSFDRVVVAELGLDRYPELRNDYFRHYRRVVWLAQRQTPELLAEAERAAGVLGLPLEVRPTGEDRLERALAMLVGD
jgi:Protein of unknown function (DUF1638)